jgi:hypothetical protein
VSIFAQIQEGFDTTMFPENSEIIKGFPRDYKNRWHIFSGESCMDSLTTCSGKKSLLLYPSLSDPNNMIQASYYIHVDNTIDADSISFSCKYMYIADSETIPVFEIKQSYMLSSDSVRDVSVISRMEHPDATVSWQDFYVKTDIKKGIIGIFITFYSAGKNMKFWLDNCHVEIDGKPLRDFSLGKEILKDKEFDEASGINLDSLTPKMIDNLEVLGKVWGFLKYYHPKVASGNYNWDYELFRILPSVANAKDREERNFYLKQWIDKYGAVETAQNTVLDSARYSRIINLDWINDSNMFDGQLIERLNLIKNAKRNWVNYYAVQQIRDFNENNSRENKYENISWEDQGFRILNLFKLWNVMEYCFPYIELTDRPWESLLKEYIPRFVMPVNKKGYVNSIRELFSNINDSHGKIDIPFASDSVVNYKIPPVKLILAKESKIVVLSSQIQELERGDVILSVDGKSIEEIIDEYKSILPESNYFTHNLDII